MAESPKAWTRLRPILHKYLEDLAKTGAYGKGKAGVIRHFVHNGIIQALEGHVIEKRNIFEHGETLEDEDDEESQSGGV